MDLPGKGLAQHPFLYTGEFDHRNTNQTIFVVRDGKVAWTYSIPIKAPDGNLQELGDATMLSNGNIVFCRKVGASEVTPDKKIIWNMEAPKGTEIHSVQPIGLDHVLVTQNGDPAKLMLINTVSGKTEKELTLPVPEPVKSPHLQFRRVHQTAAGTYLAAHLNDNKVVEYDANGQAIWSYKTTGGPWSAVRLKNGNTLMAVYPSQVLEVNKQGEIVWEFSQTNAPDYKFYIFQEASRLANGDTVICNWCAGLGDTKRWTGTVQVIEVSPEKKIVWALSQWNNPDLGPASSIQLLDEPGTPEIPGEQQR